jgi:hypothetical protein
MTKIYSNKNSVFLQGPLALVHRTLARNYALFCFGVIVPVNVACRVSFVLLAKQATGNFSARVIFL